MSTRPIVSFVVLLSFLIINVGCRHSNIDTEALNKQLVREVFSVIDEQDYIKLKTLWPEDMECVVVGLLEPIGRDETIEFISNAYAAFPDYTHEIQEVVADGNQVMVRVTNHVTHQSEFEGLAPTGKKITYQAIHLVTFENGVISEWWLLEDNLGFMSQLGMQLVPATDNG